MTTVSSAFTYNPIQQPNLVRATLTSAVEPTTITSVAATGTITYEINSQSVLYSTASAAANWTLNITFSKGQALNSYLAIGQSITLAFLVTQGATAYYNNVLQIDGATTGVTARWLGGAPTAGNASGIDSYRYLVIKTADRTFTIVASNTQFKA
jgi:hypothetical protein